MNSISLRFGRFFFLLILATGSSAAATFTYHGSLTDGGKPAEGSYDLQLTLYSAADGGKVLAGPLTMFAVPVHGGSFSTQVDFGAVANVAGTAWLGVRIRNAGNGDYVELSARSPISADLTTSTTSVCPGAWTIGGNAGNPVGSYLGTADSQPLIFEVNGGVAGQILATANGTYTDAPNVIFGSSGNHVGAAVGATVGGGGYTGEANAATGFFSTVSGGRQNTAVADSAFIGGGVDNTAAGGSSATIAGGEVNNASGQYSTVGGGIDNSAVGVGSTVVGGSLNIADGSYATVAGGSNNAAGGTYSLAAGNHANVRDAYLAGYANGDQGTFAWADSQSSFFTSTGPDQFLIRSQGGVAINTTPPNHDVELTIQQSAADGSGQASLFMRQGNTTSGALLAAGSATVGNNDATFFIYNYDPSAPGAPAVQELTLEGGNLTIAGTATKPGGGSWSAPSDRRIKHDIAPIANAVDTLLQLQPVSFRYNGDYRAQIGGLADKAYLGFVAQDYATVFPEAVSLTAQRVPGAAPDAAPILALDPNPALITTVAAVQELAIDGRARDSEVERLRAENSDLRAALDELRARVARIEAAGAH